MSKYVLTNKAVKDLAIIWNYTFDTWPEKQADKYYNDILKHCESLSKNPDQGKKYSTLIQDLRGSKINKHIVFFRKTETNFIEIVRILHEQMDLKSNLEK
ncbi:MAG: type II toxin-antitoxin system RelE/ParE family toxin [Ferruginibacter sp.]